MSPVIITQQDYHILRHRKSHFVIFLDFLVEHPHLRHFLRRTPSGLADNLALLGDDFLHHTKIGFPASRVGHRTVFIAPHANGHHAFIVLRVFYAFAEEPFDGFLVGQPVPFPVAILVLMAYPLLLRTLHRFVMRRAHHDAVFVGQARIVRVVFVEAVSG